MIIKNALPAMKKLVSRNNGEEVCQLTEVEIEDIEFQIMFLFWEGKRRARGQLQKIDPLEGQQRCILIGGESSRRRRHNTWRSGSIKSQQQSAKESWKHRQALQGS